MPTKMSIPNILARWLSFVLLFAILLFVPAGTLNWLEAWLFLGLYVAFSLFAGTWMLKNSPGLLEERLKVEKRPGKGWDMAILLLVGFLFMATLAIAGLGIRFGWPELPLAVKALGFAGIVFAFAVIFWVFRENTYVSRVVEVKKGQTVITTGPYRYVRHPMYVGAIAFFLCVPLALGSFYALIPASVTAIFMIIRTHLEDRTLQKELKGYKEYAKKTRYRLLPWIW